MNKEEQIKKALTSEVVLQTVAFNLKKGKPVELKVEKDKLVVVDIERHAKTKVVIGD